MNYKVFISFVLAALMLCSCKNSKPEAAQNADVQSEVTGKADTPETKITAGMAFEGVNNYCHEKFDWRITEENPDIMYVTMGEETDSAYQVVFRSYTGSLTHFYVDKLTGKTRIVTKVPNLGVEEDNGTIDLHDYLGKEKSAKASSSDKEASTDNKSLTGHFVSDDDGSSLTISGREDGRYSIVINLFRLTHLDDGVGGDAEGGIDFTATDANGEPIGGRITFADDTATLTFIHSSWSLIEEGAKWEFRRK
jgi:hypothetical protein